MLERQRKIADLVNARQSVRVNELSRLFSITRETVRHDLETLEREGRLKRSHGGAVAVESPSAEQHFSKREVRNVLEKQAIAAQALKGIAEGDAILMDASSSVLELARLIPDKPLTVLTNSLKVAVEVSRRTQVRVLCTGGVLVESSLSLTGPQAEKHLKDFHFDKLYFSCAGLDLKEGLSEPNESQAQLRRRMISRSARRVLLMDHSKLGLKSLSVFAGLKDVHELITDWKADPAFVAALRKGGLTVTQVGK